MIITINGASVQLKRIAVPLNDISGSYLHSIHKSNFTYEQKSEFAVNDFILFITKDRRHYLWIGECAPYRSGIFIKDFDVPVSDLYFLAHRIIDFSVVEEKREFRNNFRIESYNFILKFPEENIKFEWSGSTDENCPLAPNFYLLDNEEAIAFYYQNSICVYGYVV